MLFAGNAQVLAAQVLSTIPDDRHLEHIAVRPASISVSMIVAMGAACMISNEVGQQSCIHPVTYAAPDGEWTMPGKSVSVSAGAPGWTTFK